MTSRRAPVLLALLGALALVGPAAATQPLGVDTRVSHAGADGDTGLDASAPAIASNTSNGQSLVVWMADDSTDEDMEIWGRLLDAQGSPLGGEFQLSDMGPPDDDTYGASNPAVAYNSQLNEYLVVWFGDDDTAPLVDEENEVYVQRVAANGDEIGVDTRISSMGPDGNAAYDAFNPDVVYNAVAKEYLVTWSGDDDTGGLVDNEFEVFAQRLSGTGGQLGGDTRISDAGPVGNANYDAVSPAVAFDSQLNQYLVVWTADDDTSGAAMTGDAFEIHVRRVAAAGTPIDADDVRISSMGTDDASTSFGAFLPDVAYDAQTGEYLVAWQGDDDTSPLVDDEGEIFVQRLSATASQIGSDTRISSMGPDGSFAYFASFPAIAYNAIGDEYLVTWHGEDDTAPLVDNEVEVFAQRLSATAAQIGGDTRISDVGPDGSTSFAAGSSAVAHDSATNEYLVVFSGDDDTAPLVAGEIEVFVRRALAGSAPVAPPPPPPAPAPAPAPPSPPAPPPAAPSPPPAPAATACANRIDGTARANTLNGTTGGDRIDGKAGNDTLRGKAGDDCLLGRTGNDTLIGGKGTDILTGGPGNDTLDARDGARDTVTCGPGIDTARVDSTDTVTGCETILR